MSVNILELQKYLKDTLKDKKIKDFLLTMSKDLLLSYWDVNNGLSFINIVAENGPLEFMQSLIVDKPELLSSTHYYCGSLLHSAAQGGQLEIVNYLLEKGLNATALIAEQSALDIAITKKYDVIAYNLFQSGAVIHSEVSGAHAIHKASYHGCLNFVKRLINDDRSLLNKVDSYGQTPLIWAAKSGQDNIVDYLISVGAFLDCYTNILLADPKHRAKTAFDWAREGNHVNVIKSLAEAGAKSNARTTSFLGYFFESTSPLLSLKETGNELKEPKKIESLVREKTLNDKKVINPRSIGAKRLPMNEDEDNSWVNNFKVN